MFWHENHTFVTCDAAHDMEEPFYPFSVSEDKLLFEFESVSSQTTVRKSIVYSRMNYPGFYNLALLDETADGTYSDLTVTNNKDMRHVLATVYQTVLVFLEGHADSRIFITGSTPSRTRLYRIAISRELIKVMLRMLSVVLSKTGIGLLSKGGLQVID